MPSKSLNGLTVRLSDIDQLMNAHAAITKFKKAEAAANNAGGGLAQITPIIEALVNDPGKGKPKEVDAINRAAFVLLIAHFQGFVEDLHKEIGEILLFGKVKDPSSVIKLIKSRSNPYSEVINAMFSGLAVYEVMDAIRWQRCNNISVKSRLKRYIEIRNKIAHGSKEIVRKQHVAQLKSFIGMLAIKIDEAVYSKSSDLLGRNPW